jgi:hypothetical protein
MDGNKCASMTGRPASVRAYDDLVETARSKAPRKNFVSARAGDFAAITTCGRDRLRLRARGARVRRASCPAQARDAVQQSWVESGVSSIGD